MRISIIVPISLHSSVHPNLLTWIQNPLLVDHEIFLIVDKSHSQIENPETLQRINQILNLKLENVTVRHANIGTPGEVRNLGLSQITGDWIYFWDADDEPNVAAAIDLVEEAQSHKADVAVGLAVAESLGKDFIIHNSWFGIFRWPGLWRFALRVELVRDVSFKNWKWCEDQDFLVRSMTKAEKVLRGNRIVYKYTLQSVDSLTAKTENWIYIKQFLEELKVQASLNTNSAIPAMFQLKAILSLVPYVGFFTSLPNLIQFLRSYWPFLHRQLPNMVESTESKELLQ